MRFGVCCNERETDWHAHSSYEQWKRIGDFVLIVRSPWASDTKWRWIFASDLWGRWRGEADSETEAKELVFKVFEQFKNFADRLDALGAEKVLVLYT